MNAEGPYFVADCSTFSIVKNNEFWEEKLNPAQIVHVVSGEFGVKPDEVLSLSRNRQIIRARQACCYFLDEENLPLNAIGILLRKNNDPDIGPMDHTSVIYDINKAKKLILTDPKFKASLESAKLALGNIKFRQWIQTS